MAKRSGFLRRQESARSVWFETAEGLTNQFMLDVTLITLHRVFGFGGKRLRRFMAELGKIHDYFYPVFKVTKDNPECDRLRDEMDRLLRECCAEDEFIPFHKRYDGIKEVRY